MSKLTIRTINTKKSIGSWDGMTKKKSLGKFSRLLPNILINYFCVTRSSPKGFFFLFLHQNCNVWLNK